MPRGKRYTNNEDKVIVSKVAKYPGNLQRAFKEAGIKLNRPISSIS